MTVGVKTEKNRIHTYIEKIESSMLMLISIYSLIYCNTGVQ